ncbi:Ig-like domain-containing protein [Parabacteroides sp. OttesenSCG-928-N08]|nr:Ig-like domain-containing protein [Parabacteroides sp. OttesenSCG-928-N08]
MESIDFNQAVSTSPYNNPTTINANQLANKYTGPFLFGSNLGYLNSNWKDQDVADILTGNAEKNIEGVGVRSLRVALYESFVEQYGYEIRTKAFQHYQDLGTLNNVVFIGDRPSDAHREKRQYIRGVASESFETLYAPIWDNGENGTPVNDNNDYALYVYKLVNTYGANVKFWEIKNEPDFTKETTIAHNAPGVKPNWWDADPDPKTLDNLHAPIYSYIRMMRVAYEVIKYLNPDAFICTGGIGYESFLDALLRNTDNPDGGKVTAEYPLTGGAWFDCLSFHLYPMYYLKEWVGPDYPGNEEEYIRIRHTDAATRKVINRKNTLNNLLKEYGYDGKKYPEKTFIITETNVPNKQVKNYIGSEEAQRNYLMKLAVEAQKNGISGVYVYSTWDDKEQEEEGDEYDYKGFYKPIPSTPGEAELRMHESGVAWRTTSRLLRDRVFDALETEALNLPDNIAGGAFYSAEANDYIYILWAKTTRDLDETAAAIYHFPAAMNCYKLLTIAWDQTESTIPGNSISLTGAPLFILPNREPTADSSVSDLSLNHTHIQIPRGETLQLTATIKPDHAKDKKIRWSSENRSIASVDYYGKVTAHAVGTTTIKAASADGYKMAVCNIEIIPENISLSYITLTGYKHINVGDTASLIVHYFPENATNKELIWSSDNKNIASVDEKGIITAHSVGQTKIRATPVVGNGSKAKSSTINVRAGIPVTGIMLSVTSAVLSEGNILQLQTFISPTNAENKRVSWSSSAPKIARVDKYGNVKAISPGEAVITVTTDNSRKTASCTVSVRDPNSAIEPIQEQPVGVTPNPSNGDFTVLFTLTSASEIQIELYNLAGKPVKRLLPRKLLEAGEHRLHFTADLPKGVYLLVIRGDQLNKQQKLIIL